MAGVFSLLSGSVHGVGIGLQCSSVQCAAYQWVECGNDQIITQHNTTQRTGRGSPGFPYQSSDLTRFTAVETADWVRVVACSWSLSVRVPEGLEGYFQVAHLPRRVSRVEDLEKLKKIVESITSQI